MTLLILVLTAILIYYLFIYKNDRSQRGSNGQNKCPNCGSRIEQDFNVCPICKESLRKPCQCCGELIEGHWNFCPYCENKVNKGDKA